MPELLPIQNGWNFRELGGYQTEAGRRVRTHKLLRTGALDRLNAAEQAYLADYGVAYVVDFRSVDERTPHPDRVPAGATYVPDPAFGTMPGAKGEAAKNAVKDVVNDPVDRILTGFADKPADFGYARMVNVYEQLATSDSARSAYAKLFAVLLANDQPDRSVIFHCSVGKDRTGFGAYLVLRALGVTPAVAMQDYLYSGVVHAPRIEARKQILAAAGADARIQGIVADRMGVHRGYLEAAEAAITTGWGDLPHYLAEWLDVDAQAVARLQELYLA